MKGYEGWISPSFGFITLAKVGDAGIVEVGKKRVGIEKYRNSCILPVMTVILQHNSINKRYATGKKQRSYY